MYAKNIAALTAFAALAEQAVASHRHLHRQNVEKRQDVVVTDWVTVYHTVVAGSEPTPVADVAEVPPADIPPADIPPADTPVTTLVTSVQPAPQVSSPEPVVSAPPASPPPASQSSAVPESPSTGGLSRKRGIAYNDHHLANTFGSACKNCGWAYNWGSTAPGLNVDGLDYIPTLWGPRDMFLKTWKNDAENAIKGGCKAIFSFNEPDNAGQANLSPKDAAMAHIEHLNPYAGQTLIGAPSITNSNLPGEGVPWLESFVSECNGKCHFDFCNVHWYHEAEHADTLFAHLEESHKACGGKPIWLTEFAPIGDPSKTPEFLRKVIPGLEELPYLHAYAFFMVAKGDDKLMDDQGLNGIGQVYASL